MEKSIKGTRTCLLYTSKSGFDKKIGTENICSNINEAVAKAREAIR